MLLSQVVFLAENQKILGIPRSQSESGLFAKLRNYCFSKSPTRESVPTPSDPNVMAIPNLSSMKSASDLNLRAETTTQPTTEDSAIDFLARKSEESFVESLGIDFTAKKCQNSPTDKDSDAEPVNAPGDLDIGDNQNKTDVEAETENNLDTVTKNYSSKDIAFICSDKCKENKGARPKTGKLGERQTDPEHTKTIRSEIRGALPVHTDKLEDVEINNEHSFTPTAAFSEDSNRGIDQEVTSSDVYNNNVRVTTTGEVSVIIQQSSDFNVLENIEETNQPGTFDAETSDNEWSDFVEYNPEKN